MPQNADNEKHWFVAFVMSCRERRVGELLAKSGYECYIPIQREVHKWSDRKKIVDRLVIPRIVFIRCTEIERRKAFDRAPGLCGFINSGKGPGNPAIVRDIEMETFRAMVEKGGREVSVTNETFSPGDHVRIVEGPLEGMECELVSAGATRCIVVRLGAIGTAKMDIDLCTVRKI